MVDTWFLNMATGKGHPGVRSNTILVLIQGSVGWTILEVCHMRVMWGLVGGGKCGGNVRDS